MSGYSQGMQTPRSGIQTPRSELNQSASSNQQMPFRMSRMASAPSMTSSEKEHINFDKWVCNVMNKVAQVVAEARFLPPLPKHRESVKRHDFFLETRIVKVLSYANSQCSTTAESAYTGSRRGPPAVVRVLLPQPPADPFHIHGRVPGAAAVAPPAGGGRAERARGPGSAVPGPRGLARALRKNTHLIFNMHLMISFKTRD